VIALLTVAYHTISWRGDLDRALPDLKSVGFSTFEAVNPSYWLADASRLDHLVKTLAIRPVGAYIGGAYIYDEDHDMEMTLVCSTCEFLLRHDAKHIVVGGGHIPLAGARDEHYGALGVQLNRLGEAARGHGVRLCYHPHAGTLVETPAEIRRLMGLTRADVVSMSLDVAHIVQVGGDPIEVLREHYRRIAYIHLKDIDDHGVFVELGQGRVDLVHVVKYLKSRGFDGPVVIELDQDTEPKESARRNLAYARNHLGLEPA